MVDVDDVVTGVQARQFGDEVRRPPPLSRGPGEAVTKDVLLGDDGEIGRHEPAFERQDHGPRRSAWKASDLVMGVGRPDRLDPVSVQHRQQPVARAQAGSGDDDALAVALDLGDVRPDRVEDVDFGARAGIGEIVAAAPVGVEPVRTLGGSERRQDADGAPRKTASSGTWGTRLIRTKSSPAGASAWPPCASWAA